MLTDACCSNNLDVSCMEADPVISNHRGHEVHVKYIKVIGLWWWWLSGLGRKAVVTVSTGIMRPVFALNCPPTDPQSGVGSIMLWIATTPAPAQTSFGHCVAHTASTTQPRWHRPMEWSCCTGRQANKLATLCCAVSGATAQSATLSDCQADLGRDQHFAQLCDPRILPAV
jgi:hypothetical protein